MVTVDAAHSGLAFPALTTAFTGHAFPVCRDGVHELGAEIKVAANALRIWTGKQEQSLGVTEIERAFEFTEAGLPVRAETSQSSREGFEFGKPLSQAARRPDSFLLFLQIFRPVTNSLLIHAQKDFVWSARTFVFILECQVRPGAALVPLTNLQVGRIVNQCFLFIAPIAERY